MKIDVIFFRMIIYICDLVSNIVFVYFKEVKLFFFYVNIILNKIYLFCELKDCIVYMIVYVLNFNVNFDKSI